MKQRFRKSLALFFALLISVGGVCFGGGQLGNTVSAQEPVDRKSNQQVRNILNYFNELSYSNRCVLGAFNNVGSDVKEVQQYYEQIEESFGISPAMFSCHYVVSDTDGTLTADSIQTTNDVIREHFAEGAICMVHVGNSWHRKLIANLSDTELAADLTNHVIDFIPNCDAENPNRNPDLYNGYLKILKTIGDALEDLQNSGVTVLYRPFVEMTNPIHEGYCTSREGLESFKRVWRQHHDYLVNERGLHNLVWVYAPQASGGADKALQYYPGGDYVDVIGVTAYPGGATGSSSIDTFLRENSFDGFYQLGKPVGFSEIGIHEADNEQGDWAHVLNALKNTLPSVTFANIWSDLQGVLTDTNTNADRFLKSSFTVRLGDLPEALWSEGGYSSSGVAAAFSAEGYGGGIQMLPEGSFSADALRSAGIDVSRILSVRLDTGYGITFYTGDHFTGQAYTLISDTQRLSSIGIEPRQIQSMRVQRVAIENASLKKPVICSDPDSQPEYINDGTLEFWETLDGNPCWTVIDLQDVYLINRWEVQNVGAYGEGAESNTSDYRLQYSLDCKNWKDADVVFGNTGSVTSQKIEQISAQYVRLYVTRANRTGFESERNRCAVCEFTVFGLKQGAGRKTDWTLLDLSVKSPAGSSAVKPDAGAPAEDSLSEDTPPEDTPSQDTAKPADTSGQKTAEKSDSGGWIWLIVGLSAAVLIGGSTTVILIRRKKR